MAGKRFGPIKNIDTESVAMLSEKSYKKISGLAHEDIAAIETLDCTETKALLLNNSYYIIHMQKEICEYGQIVSGKYKISDEVCDAACVLKRFIEMAEQIATANKIRLFLSVPEGKVFIPLDESRLYHTLAALVLNSMEHTEQGDKIELSLEESKKFVKITVKDTGAGMDEETLCHYKEPLFSGRRISANKVPFGLGITISDYIIKTVGGTVKIKSAPNKGTKVCICIPRPAEDASKEIHSFAASVKSYSKNDLLEDFAPILNFPLAK